MAAPQQGNRNRRDIVTGQTEGRFRLDGESRLHQSLREGREGWTALQFQRVDRDRRQARQSRLRIWQGERSQRSDSQGIGVGEEVDGQESRCARTPFRTKSSASMAVVVFCCVRRRLERASSPVAACVRSLKRRAFAMCWRSRLVRATTPTWSRRRSERCSSSACAKQIYKTRGYHAIKSSSGSQN